MYLYPNCGLRHKFIALIFGVNWMILTCPGVKSLQCFHCDPCQNEDSGTLKTCNEKAYQDLPDEGYMGCSSELGSSGKFKKDCIWLRNDPDDLAVPISPRPMRCHTSTFDDVSLDCYCFQNFCNKHKLSPRGSSDPEAGAGAGTGTGAGAGTGTETKSPTSTAHSIQFHVPRQWILFSSLGIVLLSLRKEFC